MNRTVFSIKMPICNGRYVSDKQRNKFYKDAYEQYYHLPIECINQVFKGSDLCIKCIEREERGKRVLICNKVPNKFHTSVLHGRRNDPLPKWSRCEGSEWYTTMLKKGFTKVVDMTKKNDINIKAVNEYIATLGNQKVAEKIEKLVQTFPILSKTAAIKCLQDYKKSVTIQREPSKEVNTVNIILKPTVVIKDSSEEVYDVFEIKLEPKTILNTKYLYEPNKNKVYTSEFKYVGRYDTRNELLCTDYPDSDAEPCFA